MGEPDPNRHGLVEGMKLNQIGGGCDKNVRDRISSILGGYIDLLRT